MHGHELLEGIAAIALVFSGLVLVPAAWLARRRAAAGRQSAFNPVSERPVSHVLRLQAGCAAALSLGAAAIHVAVAPEHLAEYGPIGIAFIAVAGVQVATAVAFVAMGIGRLRGPTIAVTLAVISVWALSRTVGFPIGPDAWMPEEIQLTDSVAVFLESALILLLLLPMERLAAVLGRARVADAMSIAIVPVIGSIGLVTLVAVASMAPAVHH